VEDAMVNADTQPFVVGQTILLCHDDWCAAPHLAVVTIIGHLAYCNKTISKSIFRHKLSAALQS
jgi:hypothetical protein